MVHGAQAPRDFIAVESRHADVEEDHLGPELARDVERPHAVVRHARLVPERLQQQLERRRGIDVVVDHQDAPRHRRALRRVGALALRRRLYR